MCKINAHISLSSDFQQACTLIILCFHVAPKKTVHRIWGTALIRVGNKAILINCIYIQIFMHTYAYIHIHCVHCVYHKYMHTQYMHILRAYIHKLRKRITKYITYTTLSIYICIFGGFWRLVQPCRYLHGNILLSNYPIRTICWIASFSIMMQ